MKHRYTGLAGAWYPGYAQPVAPADTDQTGAEPPTNYLEPYPLQRPRVSCNEARVIDVAPVLHPGHLPKVVYGLPSPCLPLRALNVPTTRAVVK